MRRLSERQYARVVRERTQSHGSAVLQLSRLSVLMALPLVVRSVRNHTTRRNSVGMMGSCGTPSAI